MESRSDDARRASRTLRRQVPKDSAKCVACLFGNWLKTTGRLAEQRVKWMVVVRRIVPTGRSAVMIMACVIMRMAGRGDLTGQIGAHRHGTRMRAGTMGRDHDKRRDDQREYGGQHDHMPRRLPGPVMEGRHAHALRSRELPYPPWGDIECL